MTTELVVQPNQNAVINFEEYAMSASQVVKQVKMIEEVMRSVMHEGVHYGTIPGTDKPTLLKPGAEKLNLTFRFAPEYTIETKELPRDHREYRVTCRLIHIPTGYFVGMGVGICSTMESKYRYKSDLEFTGKGVPKEYWKDKDVAMLGGKGFVAKKNPVTQQWEIAKIAGKVEHDNPADFYNTCEKMAKKRSHTDAILGATAASDIFTQDVDDSDEVEEHNKGNGTPPAGEPAKPDKPSEKQLGLIQDLLDKKAPERQMQWLSDVLKRPVEALSDLGKADVRDVFAVFETLGWTKPREEKK